MSRRNYASVALLVLALVLLAGQVRRILADPSFWPPDDFVEYWCAGWLNLQGENPYNPVRMYQLEQDIGWDIGQAVMMWNPPWTLSLAMPLGLLPWRVAQIVWLFVKLAALAYCADRLWRYYAGPPARVWIGWTITFTFFPTLVALNVGQISPFLLLGATLFLILERAGLGFWAGFACVLLSVKPHLAYLFWLAVGLDAVFNRRFAIVLGGLSGGVAASLWPLLENPVVFGQYFAALRDHPPAQWMSLTGGTLLRLAFGSEHFWLQFLPPAVGFAWFAFSWAAHRRRWDWGERLPWLLFVSFVTAPYGAWPYDLVLLLLPMLRLAARLAAEREGAGSAVALLGFVAVNAAMIGLNVAEVYSVWFAWVAPVLLVLALVVEQRLSPRPHPAAATG
jgi:hypothetical protein